MLHAVLLGIHVVAGTLGLLLGPVVMWQDTRRLAAGRSLVGGSRYRWGPLYLWSVLIVGVSAVGLVAIGRPDLWWLVPVAALTYALAVLGRHALAARFRAWTHAYVHGQGGSYIALVTALVVVAFTLDGTLVGPAVLLPWLLPTVVGTPLIERWRRRLLAATSLARPVSCGSTGGGWTGAM